MSDEIRDIFTRQRRNLMAMSLVLLVADVSNDIHVGPASLYVHAPFTIMMVLWMVWGYWLWRYYTSFHELDVTKGIFITHRNRLNIYIERLAAKMLERDPTLSKMLRDNLNTFDGKRGWYIVSSSYGRKTPSTKEWSLVLNILVTDPNEMLPAESMQWHPEVTIDGFPFYVAKVRAWGYMVFRTTVFSEYFLPFLFAVVVGLYGIYKYFCVS
jgi:hypothetical protein